MRRLALDTNALIRFFERGDALADLFSRYDRLAIPAAVAAEFLIGLDVETKNGKKQRQKFEEFLLDESVEFSPADEDVVLKYVELYCYLKRRGLPIPTNDMWIAATALVRNAALCTGDEHFSRIPLLTLERI